MPLSDSPRPPANIDAYAWTLRLRSPGKLEAGALDDLITKSEMQENVIDGVAAENRRHFYLITLPTRVGRPPDANRSVAG